MRSKKVEKLTSLQQMKGKTVKRVTKGIVIGVGRALVIKFTDGSQIWVGGSDQNVCSK